MDDLTSLTDSYLEAKAVISLGRNPFPAALLSDLPDLTVRPGAEGPDRPPTIPPASGSGVTSPGAEGPDKPSATRGPGHQGPGGAALGPALDDEQTGRRGPYLCGSDDRARYTSRIGRKTSPSESGGVGEGYASQEPPGGWTPWARYSVDELNQQAKAGDRPYPGDLRSIFWAAPHDPDEDFHWTRQISSWTLPAYWGCSGTATPCASSGESGSAAGP